MDDVNKRASKIKAKVATTLKNADTLSQKDIDMVWNEAVAFLETLPKEKRGAFYWNSGGLEALFLLTSESKGS